MGAGDFLAGMGTAGFDPPVVPSPARNVRPPHALLFDGATRDVPLTDQGSYAEVHPVDQRVALALFVTLASIPSAPEIGNTLASVRIQDAASMQRDAEGRVRQALQDELNANNIELVAVAASVTPRWRVSVVVKYRNLRLPDSPIATITANP